MSHPSDAPHTTLSRKEFVRLARTQPEELRRRAPNGFNIRLHPGELEALQNLMARAGEANSPTVYADFGIMEVIAVLSLVVGVAALGYAVGSSGSSTVTVTVTGDNNGDITINGGHNGGDGGEGGGGEEGGGGGGEGGSGG